MADLVEKNERAALPQRIVNVRAALADRLRERDVIAKVAEGMKDHPNLPYAQDALDRAQVAVDRAQAWLVEHGRK